MTSRTPCECATRASDAKPALAACLLLIAALAPGCASPPLPARVAGTAQGTVFEDRNGNGIRDAREPGLANVRVSNGREIVTTNRHGHWQLPVHGDTNLFVIKPTGMRTARDDRGLPRFYYLHRPEGSSPDLGYRGIPPTGALPDSIDFPLTRQREATPFRVLIVGDPQPRTIREVDYFLQDVVAELPDHEAAFGVTLGDLVGDALDLYEPISQSLGLVGIPWRHVFGNHDMNLDAGSKQDSNETFQRFFGPTTYAFEYARVHFIALDDIDFRPASDTAEVGYRGGIGERELIFIENYVQSVPRDEAIVLLMHIPLVGPGIHQVPQRDRLFEILADHPYSWSISAHTHVQGHTFLGTEAGNPGPVHHHWNSSTASGSWWRGRRDERGIPHTTMRDGSPNGYSIVTFDGTDYSIRFKAARRPANHQIHIHAPDEVEAGAPAAIHANVFAGSERSRVDVRIRGVSDEDTSAWSPMELTRERDPAFLALREREARALAEDESALPFPNDSRHLWRALLAADLSVGSHWIEVRSTDMFGQVDISRRVLRVRPAQDPEP